MSRVLAPAKLTLSLEVTGVRSDGYHELRAEMVALNLADELTFTEGSDGLTVAAAPGSRADGLGNDQGNLIVRALAATGRVAGVHVVKRIPVGGGLGGGSTDAAAVLRWAGTDDLELALQLGADVPFSLTGGRALVEGVGERITPLPFEPRRFLLLVPPFGVDTGLVYKAWDELAQGAAGRDAGVQGPGRNALTSAALVVEPRLARWREALQELSGADPILAGSGSTWFVSHELETGTEVLPSVRIDGEEGLLLRAHTVPAGWEGD
ncbi:MAG TPA: 4-(cytidine 5'-diphospho)-2-C-methyl-D-erythritol kinase [Acidimicrobiales bacterium]|nr:4-(cytidine 5'-diphospho)-2-C-methyl-D-erythritol kinase [Acidimicrobiales bacterium]